MARRVVAEVVVVIAVVVVRLASWKAAGSVELKHCPICWSFEAVLRGYKLLVIEREAGER